jgi:hypothetical protein
LPKIEFEDLEPIGFYDEKKAHIVDDRVFEKIGSGSCGAVIKAKMRSTGAAVAVKILTDASKFGVLSPTHFYCYGVHGVGQSVQILAWSNNTFDIDFCPSNFN